MQRRVNLLKAEGIEFVTNCEVGKTIPAQQLLDDYDAVVLCGGATKPNDFFARTEGRDLKGIHFAMEFLHGNTKHLLDSRLNHSNNGHFISAKDKDVVVLGGGTGTDCVGTSLRHGCRSLVQTAPHPSRLLACPSTPYQQCRAAPRYCTGSLAGK